MRPLVYSALVVRIMTYHIATVILHIDTAPFRNFRRPVSKRKYGDHTTCTGMLPKQPHRHRSMRSLLAEQHRKYVIPDCPRIPAIGLPSLMHPLHLYSLHIDSRIFSGSISFRQQSSAPEIRVLRHNLLVALICEGGLALVSCLLEAGLLFTCFSLILNCPSQFTEILGCDL